MSDSVRMSQAFFAAETLKRLNALEESTATAAARLLRSKSEPVSWLGEQDEPVRGLFGVVRIVEAGCQPHYCCCCWYKCVCVPCYPISSSRKSTPFGVLYACRVHVGCTSWGHTDRKVKHAYLVYIFFCLRTSCGACA